MNNRVFARVLALALALVMVLVPVLAAQSEDQPATEATTDLAQPASAGPRSLGTFGTVCAIVTGGAAGMLIVRKRRKK